MSAEETEPYRYEIKKIKDTMGDWQIRVWTPNGDDHLLYEHRQEEILDRVAPIVVEAFGRGVQVAQTLMHLHLRWKFEKWLSDQAMIETEITISEKVEEW